MFHTLTFKNQLIFFIMLQERKMLFIERLICLLTEDLKVETDM